MPARLHVVLARDAPTAVVIRRGRSREVATIGWDRSTDAFALGQWLRGRIYERRCDLSPDGRFFLYFAMNGRWSSRAKGSWSAISEAPYLKARALWAKGDCWHGGGLFLDRKRFWLNGCGYEELESDARLERSLAYPWHEAYGGECPGVYYIRLQRDGWAMQPTVGDGKGGFVTVFEKNVSSRWTLRKLAHATSVFRQGTGCYFDEHELVDGRTRTTCPQPTWEWAEVDGERLVWAEEGRLYAARVGASGIVGARMLFDFNDMVFERIRAPYDPEPRVPRRQSRQRERKARRDG